MSPISAGLQANAGACDERMPAGVHVGRCGAQSLTRQDSLFLARRRLSLAAPGKHGGAQEQRRANWRPRLSLNPGSLLPMRRMSSACV